MAERNQANWIGVRPTTDTDLFRTGIHYVDPTKRTRDLMMVRDTWSSRVREVTTTAGTYYLEVVTVPAGEIWVVAMAGASAAAATTLLAYVCLKIAGDYFPLAVGNVGDLGQAVTWQGMIPLSEGWEVKIIFHNVYVNDHLSGWASGWKIYL